MNARAKPNQEWSAKAVVKALTEAFRVLEQTQRHVGHSRVKAAWPDYAYSSADKMEQKLAGTARYGKLKARIQPSSIQISHMEIALLGKDLSDGGRLRPWLDGAVKLYPDRREKLLLAAKFAARGISGRQLCERMHWAEATFRFQRNHAAGVIAKELNRAGLEAW